MNIRYPVRFTARWVPVWAMALFIPAVLHAEDVLIDGLLGGANGDSTAQFVELRYHTEEDRFWGPQGGELEGRARLVFMDARGNTVTEFVFPSDPPLGVEDPVHGGFSVLVATQAFADLNTGPVPDFIMPAGVIADSGKVCFTDNPDNPTGFGVHLCIAYGNFVGATEDLSGQPAVALPIINASALARTGSFDQWSLQSNTDFSLVSAAPRNSAGAIGQLIVESEVVQGETLFTRESFQGNGRTCLTCHRPEDQFGLSPATIELLPANDPLFIAEFDPNLAELENPCMMNDGRALILENIDGFGAPPVFRTSPHLLNVSLTAPYGLSGEFEDLREFTTGAVQQHFPKTLARNSDPSVGPMDFRLPTDEELAMMEAFQNSISFPDSGDIDIDTMIQSAIERGGDADEINAGRDLFFGDAKCFNCHNGPVLGDPDPLLDNGNVTFNTGVVNLAVNDFLDCLGGPMPPEAGGERRFSVPPLVGVSLTAPFFHDASVDTLDDAIGFYALGVFDDSPAGILIGGIDLTNDEADQIQAFLEALVEPNPVHNLTQVTGFTTIQAAIDAAVNGDEIQVDPGTYVENLDFLGKNITLFSRAPLEPAIVATTILDGGGAGPVVVMSGGRLTGFTIQNGLSAGPIAGGVEAEGLSEVSHNIIINNTADQRGGGVSAVDFAFVHNNLIMNNIAGNRAGGVSARDNSHVINNVISNNHAPIGGGGLRAQESAVIRNNTLIGNSSEEQGSGVQGGGGILAENSATLLNNIVAFSPDGVGIHAAVGSTVTANHNCVFGNIEGDYSGDAVPGPNDLNVDPLLDVDGVHLTYASPCVNAGDPNTLAELEEDETDIDDNERIFGDLVDIGADELLPVRNLTQGQQFTLVQSAIDAALDGDEIEVSPGDYLEHLDFLGKDITLRSINPFDDAIVASTFLNGFAEDTVVRMTAGILSGFSIINGGASGDVGAGVDAGGTAVVSHNQIVGNVADIGGGVRASGTALIHNNLISSNSAFEHGAGVSAHDDAVVINNYIALNAAEAGGGGVHTVGTPTVRNNTILFNSSADVGSGLVGGGGILVEGRPILTNNVVAFSIDGAGLHVNPGDDVVADYNCLFGNIGGDYGGDALPAPNDINDDPLIDLSLPPHLLPGSPCINVGDPLLVTLEGEIDYDGEIRIQGGRVDVGADETAVLPCPGDANHDGTVDPLDSGFVQARFGCVFPQDGTHCLDADVNEDGIVDPLDVGFILARFGLCE